FAACVGDDPSTVESDASVEGSTPPGNDATAASDVASAAPYRGLVLGDRPVAYYRLGESGGVAHDETTGHDGTYLGGIVHGVAGGVAGDDDRAVQLNGMSGRIEIADLFDFEHLHPFSLEAWIAPTADAGGVIVAKIDSTDGGPPTRRGFLMQREVNGTISF